MGLQVDVQARGLHRPPVEQVVRGGHGDPLEDVLARGVRRTPVERAAHKIVEESLEDVQARGEARGGREESLEDVEARGMIKCTSRCRITRRRILAPVCGCGQRVWLHPRRSRQLVPGLRRSGRCRGEQAQSWVRRLDHCDRPKGEECVHDGQTCPQQRALDLTDPWTPHPRGWGCRLRRPTRPRSLILLGSGRTRFHCRWGRPLARDDLGRPGLGTAMNRT